MTSRTGLARFTGILSDVYLKFAYLTINWPAAIGPYRRRTDLSYGEASEQRLDVYMPKKPAPRTPLIVCWQGGRWAGGDKSEFRFVGSGLAELGFISVVPNFRRYPKVKIAGIMEDAARAALWASANAQALGADPERIFWLGHSAGAHMAVLLALDDRYFELLGSARPRIAGVIGLSGPYNFLPLRGADLEDIFGPPERYAETQPINFARPGAPPMLLAHGLNDSMVPPSNSAELAQALTAHGAHATLKLYPNLKHAETVAAISVPARKYAPTLSDIADFVRRS